MKKSVTFKQKNPGWLKKRAKEVLECSKSECAVGFPKGKGLDTPTGDGASVLEKAIWNNFGAEINHPGGTAYRREQISGGAYAMGRAEHKVRFVKNSDKRVKELPRTKPHKIKIPARPFMDLATPAITDKWKELQAGVFKEAAKSGKTVNVKETLEAAGVMAVGEIQKAIDALDSPPNAPGTKRKKKSANPLIDSGDMKKYVIHDVRDKNE